MAKQMLFDIINRFAGNIRPGEKALGRPRGRQIRAIFRLPECWCHDQRFISYVLICVNHSGNGVRVRPIRFGFREHDYEFCVSLLGEKLLSHSPKCVIHRPWECFT